MAEITEVQATVAFLPWNEGDGYNWGGGALLVIGETAIPLGCGQPAKELAQEIARRWNVQRAAAEGGEKP